MVELDESIYKKIVELCEAGDMLADDGNYNEAIQNFRKAARLIPKPVQKWEAATWILTAIGETYFFMQDYVSALENLHMAMHCSDAIGHPLIHLRLGQVHFELGNEESTKFEVVPPPLRVNRAFQQIAHPLSHLRTVPETTVRMGLLDSLP